MPTWSPLSSHPISVLIQAAEGLEQRAWGTRDLNPSGLVCCGPFVTNSCWLRGTFPKRRPNEQEDPHSFTAASNSPSGAPCPEPPVSPPIPLVSPLCAPRAWVCCPEDAPRLAPPHKGWAVTRFPSNWQQTPHSQGELGCRPSIVCSPCFAALVTWGLQVCKHCIVVIGKATVTVSSTWLAPLSLSYFVNQWSSRFASLFEPEPLSRPAGRASRSPSPGTNVGYGYLYGSWYATSALTTSDRRLAQISAQPLFCFSILFGSFS